MKCKINRNAAKLFKNILASDQAQGKHIRVFVTHIHEDHAHYDYMLDVPTEHDEVVATDKEIDIILEKDNPYLDGIWIRYFQVPEEAIYITNSKFGIHRM